MYVLPEERYINEFLRGGYEPLDEEFPVTDSDWKWLVTHTEYTEQELRDMLHGLRYYAQYSCQHFYSGFRVEYPGGGIYRHQLEQMTGNVVMNVIFKWDSITFSHFFNFSLVLS